MFPGITKSVLDDPEFKEDSVRELIIAPMIAKLGYLPAGNPRVIRSKTLKHPFIRVGTRNHPVKTIPDYSFVIDEKTLFILDAKAPNEGVLNPEHVQQAYSYAIHPEVRCEEFGLCNGKELVIFSVAQEAPLLQISFEQFESNWSEIEKFLTPRHLREPALRRFAPDFGLALKRMGIQPDTELIMMEIRLNMFERVNDELMTASANTDFGSGPHCVSFDFHPKMLSRIVSGLPEPLAEQFSSALSRVPFQASAGLVIELDLTATLGEETLGQSEAFIPLVIKEIHASRFNPSEDQEDTNEYPPGLFKLRDTFVVGNGNA
jgi:hypothetical protein